MPRGRGGPATSPPDTARGSPHRRARGSWATAVLDQQHVRRRRDKTLAMTSTGSNFKRWVFARHSHPWSVWTRWASTPLVLLPVWNRSAGQGVVVAAWLALSPVLFPPPRDDSAFATRAVLGEERWLEERPASRALAINCMAGAALLIAIDSARRHRRLRMTIATIGTMSGLLRHWREMVHLYETRGHGQSSAASDPTTSGATLAARAEIGARGTWLVLRRCPYRRRTLGWMGLVDMGSC